MEDGKEVKEIIPTVEQEVSREEVYKKFAETQTGAQPETAPVEAEKESETPVEEAKPSVEAEKEVKEEPVKTEAEVQKEQEKEHNLKKALDEERIKRKRLKEEKDALEIRIREFESKQETPKEPDPITDYDAELNAVKTKLRSIELMEARREEFARQEAIRSESAKLQSMVDSVHKDLLEEGYAGFKRMAGEVTRELMELAKTDPDEAQSMDNPDGWKKIFKEKIYPDFHKEVEETTRKRTLDDKKNLKKDVNLNTSSGKAPKKVDDDDPDTWSEDKKRQEYLKTRRQL